MSCAHEVSSLYIKGEERLSTMWKKVKKKKKKNDLTVISKLHAYPHTMKTTHAKCHNNRYKTVRSCAHKRYQLFIYKRVKNDCSQCGKSDKKWSNNYIQTTCITSYYEENICKVSKWSVQNCKRSCAHKRYPLYIEGEKRLSSQCVEKVTKNNLTIISKPHPHPHTMKKTQAKFQNDQYKTVRGVSLTRHSG